MEQIILKVKLLDIGPPKVVLRLAMQPPDPDDIERTVLLLKQVRYQPLTNRTREPHWGIIWPEVVAFADKNTRLMTVSVETVRFAKYLRVSCAKPSNKVYLFYGKVVRR